MITRGAGSFAVYAEDTNGIEHKLTVTYGGYSDPGITSGPPERCYPPEGEIEWQIVGGLPEGIDFGDLEKLEERIEQEAWDHLERYGNDGRYL